MSRFSKLNISSVLIALGLALVCPASVYAKTVNLEWKAIPGAVAYEIQISKKGKVFAKKKLEDLSWSGNLSFGVFSYQIRAFDKLNRPGTWSEPLALVVMPQSPEGTYPDNGLKVRLFSENAKLTLKWTAVPETSKYKVRIFKGRSVFLEKTVDTTALDIPNPPEGEYTWKIVGIIEAAGRTPSSLSSKKWESKPSDEMSFRVNRGTLEAPKLINPISVLAPSKDGVVAFNWTEVDGAEKYELTLLPSKIVDSARNPAKANAPKTFIVPDNKVALKIPVLGKYRWQVRALANIDSKSAASSVGPKSEASFEINKNALFVDGSGYVALSTMIAPYDYRIIHPATNTEGNLKSNSITFRLSGEYWIAPQSGLAAGIENTSFTISGASYQRRTYELQYKYRSNLSRDKYGWSFSPKVGIEGREYFFITPNPEAANVLDSSDLMALGAAVGLDIRKQFNDRFSLGAKLAYFQPLVLVGAPSGSKITGDASNRNLSVGVQGLFWLSKRWGLGLGAYYEKRSLSYEEKPIDSVAPAGANQVFMDATYFFGSLIFSFGR